jgi:lysozyme
MATQRQTANAALRPSQVAYSALRRYENVRYEYYDKDGAGNCTWGAGFLAHHGPCTPKEHRRIVTVAQVNTTLATVVNEAAAVVRRNVPNQPLTQAQFDALVTYTFNRGPSGAHHALSAANQGNHATVVSIMNRNIYGHKKGHPVILHGLMIRRLEESAPFLPQPQRQGKE